MAGLDELDKIIEGTKKNNVEFTPTEWLKLEDGETVSLRFLQEADTEGLNYDEDLGIGLPAIEHQAGADWRKRMRCTIDSEGQCYGCERARQDPQAGWGQKRRYYINVLVKTPEGPQVKVLNQPISSTSVVNTIKQVAAEDRSITDVPWSLTRNGTNKNTSYTLVPKRPPAEPFDDFKDFELFDLENAAARKIPFEDQQIKMNDGVVNSEGGEGITSWDDDDKAEESKPAESSISNW